MPVNYAFASVERMEEKVLLSAPSVPTGLKATATGQTSIFIDWNNSSGADNYRLERRQGTSGSFNQIYFSGASQYNDSGNHLSEDTTYQYRVRASNSSGDSAYSSIVTVKTFPDPPGVPGGLTATATGQTSVFVDWNGVSGADNYKLERRRGTSGSFTQIYFSNASQYNDSGNHLSADTTYQYRVRATNDGGDSNYSSIVTVRTFPEVPDAPGGLTAEATGQTSVFVDWNGVSGADNYKLERRRGTSGSFTQIYFSNASQYNDSGNHLSADTTYQYRVRATNDGGDSNYSSIVTVRTFPEVPDAPGGLTAEATGQTSVFVDWNGVSGADNYKLERREGTSGNFTQIYFAAASEYTDSGNHLSADTTYQYRVRATNDGGDSNYSSIVTVRTFPEVPDAPGGLTAEATGQTSVFVDWNGVSGADNYKLERREGTSGNFTQIYFAAASEYTDSGNHLSADTTYQYRVRATNDGGDSNYSSIVTVRTFPEVPDAPGGLTAEATGQTSVFVDWNGVSGADNYKLERRRGTSGSFTQIYFSNASQYNDSGNHLSADTTYQYRVRATNDGGDSNYSSIVTVRTFPEVPDAPGGLTAEATGQTSVFVDWNGVSGADNYKLERRRGTSGSFTQIYFSNASQYNDSGNHLSADTTYQYRVRATNDGGDSNYSSIVTVRTFPEVPDAPGGLTAEATGQTSVFVDWNGVSGADNYKLERRRGTSGSFTQIYFSNASQYNDSGNHLSADTTYQYRVRATNDGGDSNYSSIVTVRTFPEVPDAPGGLTAEATGQTSVFVDWNGVSGADNYKLERREGTSGNFTQIYFAAASEYTDSGNHLSADTTYQYRVRATNDGGDSNYSSIVTVRTFPEVPDAPGGLTAEATGQTSVFVDWNGVSGADNYKLERREGTSGNFTQIYFAAASEYTDSGNHLSADTTYQYRVRATNDGGDSNYSSIVTVRTFPEVPDAPGGLTAEATGQTSVFVDWNGVSGADNYKLERREGTSGNFTQIYFAAASEYNDSGNHLSADTTYQYRVRATNDGGDSNYSSIVTVRTFPEVPDAPGGLTAEATGQTSVFVDWNGVSGADNYKLERREGTSGNFTQIYFAAASEYNDSGNHLSADTTYQYRVRATNDGGDSNYSSIVTVRTFPEVPDAPGGLTAEATGQTSVFVDWNGVSGADNYKLERREGTSGNFTQIYFAAASEYNDSGNHLSADTTYQYRVRATNDGGDSDYSSIVTVKTLADEPAAPSGLTATATGQTSVSVDWDPVNNADNYKLERREGTSGNFTQIYFAAASEYVDSGDHLSVDTTYQYRVRATNDGGDSDYSSIVTVKTLADEPAAPSGLTATATGQTSVSVDWDPVNNADNYKLERREGTSGNFTQIYFAAASEYVDSGDHLSVDTTYQYRVRATNDAGDSDYSSIVTVKTLADEPAAPSGLTATATGQTSVSVDWDPVNNADNYKLERREGTSGNFTQIYFAAASEYVDSGDHLSVDTTYQYRVRATNDAGDSDYSSIVTVKTLADEPAAPSGLTATATGQTSVSVDWDPVNNADNYKLERREGTSGNFTQIYFAAASEYVDSGDHLSVDTTYQYRVRATNDGGDSDYSSIVTVKTLADSSERTHGIDVSRHQGAISWADVATTNIQFAYIKATEGNGAGLSDPIGARALDSRFAENSAGAVANGIIAGAYHFARPDLGNSAQAEAQWFVSQAANIIGDGHLPPVVDVEGNALNLPSGELSAWVEAWSEEVERLTGVLPVLYASQAWLPYINQDPRDMDLWVARYNGENPNEGTPGSVTPWSTGAWRVWQYTDAGQVHGIQANVDLNVFNGPLSDLMTWSEAGEDPHVTAVSSSVNSTDEIVTNWTTTGQVHHVRLYLLDRTGQQVADISENLPRNGTHAWKIPPGLPRDSDYQVMAVAWKFSDRNDPHHAAFGNTFRIESTGQGVFDTAFLTDAELVDFDAMSESEIRQFLNQYGSYFGESVADIDDVVFDAAAVISAAATQYRINPQVLLATLQKESSGVTSSVRPSDVRMRSLMGVGVSTAREQLVSAAERFRAYHDALLAGGTTVSGWKAGVPKDTEDNVRVTPATNAVAGQFTYTPYAGEEWGGSAGGVYLFYATWRDFGFASDADVTGPAVDLISPNSGSFPVGSTITLRATATDRSNISHVQVELYAGGTSREHFVGIIHRGNIGDGYIDSVTWTIPEELNGRRLNGNDFKIKWIAWDDSPGRNPGFAFSEGNLSIEGSDAPPPLFYAPWGPGAFRYYNGRSFYYNRRHLGADIDLPEGAPIRAGVDGTIVRYEAVTGYGNLAVVIEVDLGREMTFVNGHGDSVQTRTVLWILGHLRRENLTWSVGDRVTPQDIVGYIERDAPHESPDPNGDGAEHLHLGLRLQSEADARAVDPAPHRGYDDNEIYGRYFADPMKAIGVIEGAPGIPGGLQARGTGPHSVEVSWVPVVGAAEYQLFRSRSVSGPWQRIYRASDAFYSDVPQSANPHLEAEKDYFYYVVASNSAGDSGASTIVRATTLPPAAPPPSNVVASVESSTAIRISWNSDAEDTGFRILRSVSADSGFEEIARSDSWQRSHIDEGYNLRPGVTYHYRVESERDELPSSAAAATIPSLLPPVPARATTPEELEIEAKYDQVAQLLMWNGGGWTRIEANDLNVDWRRKSILLTHGWNDSVENSSAEHFTQVFAREFSSGQNGLNADDFNILAIDWYDNGSVLGSAPYQEPAASFMPLLSAENGIKAAQPIARRLINFGFQPEHALLIGHSNGAGFMASLADTMFVETGRKTHSLVALDAPWATHSYWQVVESADSVANIENYYMPFVQGTATSLYSPVRYPTAASLSFGAPMFADAANITNYELDVANSNAALGLIDGGPGHSKVPMRYALSAGGNPLNPWGFSTSPFLQSESQNTVSPWIVRETNGLIGGDHDRGRAGEFVVTLPEITSFARLELAEFGVEKAAALSQVVRSVAYDVGTTAINTLESVGNGIRTVWDFGIRAGQTVLDGVNSVLENFSDAVSETFTNTLIRGTAESPVLAQMDISIPADAVMLTYRIDVIDGGNSGDTLFVGIDDQAIGTIDLQAAKAKGSTTYSHWISETQAGNDVTLSFYMPSEEDSSAEFLVSQIHLTTVDTTGPKMSVEFSGTDNQITSARISLTEPIQFNESEAREAVRLTGPDGPIGIDDVVLSADRRILELVFAPQYRAGDYEAEVRAEFKDLSGNHVDNNENGIAGESDDKATAAASILPGFIVTPDDTVSVVEDGDSHTYFIQLTAQPEQSVVLNIENQPTHETVLSAGTLTFDESNWSIPQSLTVSARDDFLVDGVRTTFINVSVDTENSDTIFHSVSTQTLTVNTTDNDFAGFIIRESDGSTNVDESGRSDTVEVLLTAQPESSVVLQIDHGDVSETTASESFLTFTVENWNQPQTISVFGVADQIKDGDQQVLIDLTVFESESDPAFHSVSTQTISVLVTDTTEGFESDIDGDGVSAPLTDGILMIRFLAGFRGDALTEGAVSSSGNRVDPVAVTEYLEQAYSEFDIDLDGETGPLTDGILFIRYLAGFTGNALIDRAQGENSSRTAQEMEDYLAQFAPASAGGLPMISAQQTEAKTVKQLPAATSHNAAAVSFGSNRQRRLENLFEDEQVIGDLLQLDRLKS